MIRFVACGEDFIRAGLTALSVRQLALRLATLAKGIRRDPFLPQFKTWYLSFNFCISMDRFGFRSPRSRTTSHKIRGNRFEKHLKNNFSLQM